MLQVRSSYSEGLVAVDFPADNGILMFPVETTFSERAGHMRINVPVTILLTMLNIGFASEPYFVFLGSDDQVLLNKTDFAGKFDNSQIHSIIGDPHNAEKPALYFNKLTGKAPYLTCVRFEI